MPLLTRLEASLERLLHVLVGGIILCSITINFVNVVARYLFAHPLIWAEEVMQLLSVWVVMLGAAIVTRRAAHLKMDAVYTALSPRGRHALDGVAHLFALVVSLYVIVEALHMIRMLTTTGQRSIIVGLRMDLMYLAIPLGFGAAATFVVVWFLRLLLLRGRAGGSGSRPGA